MTTQALATTAKCLPPGGDSLLIASVNKQLLREWTGVDGGTLLGNVKLLQELTLCIYGSRSEVHESRRLYDYGRTRSSEPTKAQLGAAITLCPVKRSGANSDKIYCGRYVMYKNNNG